MMFSQTNKQTKQKYAQPNKQVNNKQTNKHMDDAKGSINARKETKIKEYTDRQTEREIDEEARSGEK